jgi:ribosomal protein L19E
MIADQLLTTRQVADALGITREGVQKLIETGTIQPAAKIANAWVFTPAAVRQARKRRKRGRPPVEATQ